MSTETQNNALESAEPLVARDLLRRAKMVLQLVDKDKGSTICTGGLISDISTYLAAPIAAQPDVTQQTLDDVMAGIPARDAEIEALRKENEQLRQAINRPVSAEPVAHAMEAIMGYRLEFKPGEYCYYTPEGYALEAYKGDAPAHALYANPQPGCPSEVEVYKGWCWVRPKYNSGNIVDETFRPLFLGPQLGAPGAAQAQTSGDRAMLESLMRSFDMEMWNCPNCTATEETKDCDSAIMLREYLANNPVTVQAQQPVSGAGGLADYPTHGMNLGQRIAHVGGRENAQGYVEFGSPMAVHALIQHVLRDFHRQGRVNLVPAQQTTDPLQGAADWLVKDCGVSDPAVLANRLGIGYNRASRLVDAARKEQA